MIDEGKEKRDWRGHERNAKYNSLVHILSTSFSCLSPFLLLVVYTHSFNFKTQEEWVNRRQRR